MTDSLMTQKARELVRELWIAALQVGAPDAATLIERALAASEAKGWQDGVREGMKRGFLAGFNASGEGWNGEYPFGDRNISPETDENFIEARDFALSNIDEANQ